MKALPATSAGVSYSQLVHLVQDFYSPAGPALDEPGPSTAALPIAQNVDGHFMSFIWSTLVQERNIQVGHLGQFEAASGSEDEQEQDATADASATRKGKCQEKGKQKDKKPMMVAGPFTELDENERQLPQTELLAKFGDNLRVAADPETTWQAITGSSARPSSLTPPVYAMLQLVSQGRGDGATTIAIGHTLGIDQKAAFHLVKQALNLGLVKKIRALDSGSWTNRVIHIRYLSVSPHWAIHSKNEDNGGNSNTELALLSDEEQTLNFGARPWIRMSPLDHNYLDTNPDLIRRRIVKALKQREDHIMPHGHIAPSVGFHTYTKQELRRFNALISRMCTDNILEKIASKGFPSDETEDAEGGGGGGVRSVRLLRDPYAKTQDGTLTIERDNEEADWEDLPKALAFIPIERQILDIVVQSDSEGVLISELSQALSNLSVRALTTILARLSRSDSISPELADFEIVVVEENEGRERRSRYFSIGGYIRRCERDNAFEEVSERKRKLQTGRIGKFPELNPKLFCKTPRDRRAAVNKIDVRKFKKLNKPVKVQRFDPWTVAPRVAKRGRPSLTASAQSQEAVTGESGSDNESASSSRLGPPPKKGKVHKNVDEQGRPIIGRPRKPLKLDKDGKRTLTYYERRKLENERRVSMGLEPITKGPLLKLAQQSQKGKDVAMRSEKDVTGPSAASNIDQQTGSRRSSPRKRDREVTSDAAPNYVDREADQLHEEDDTQAVGGDSANLPAPVKRRRGRPPKQAKIESSAAEKTAAAPAVNAEASATAQHSHQPGNASPATVPVPVKRGRGRPRKNPLPDSGVVQESEPSTTQAGSQEAHMPISVRVTPAKRRNIDPGGQSPTSVPAATARDEPATMDRDGDDGGVHVTIVNAPASSSDRNAGAAPVLTEMTSAQSFGSRDAPSEGARSAAPYKSKIDSRTTKKIRRNLTSVARQAEILAWLKHENGMAELSGASTKAIYDIASKAEPTKRVTTMDRDVLLAEVNDMVERKLIKKTTVSLLTGRRDLLLLPDVDLESEGSKTFLKRLNDNPRGQKPALPVANLSPREAKPRLNAIPHAMPSLDDDDDEVVAYFKSNPTILSHMYGCAYGRVARARILHKAMIEYVANHDVDGICLHKQPNMISPDFTMKNISLGDYLQIVPLAIDSEELMQFISSKDNLGLQLRELPKDILQIVSPRSHARQKSLWRVVDVLISLNAIKPLVQAPAATKATGAFLQPNRLTAATHWELSVSVPVYSFNKVEPKLIEVASCETPEQVEAFWKALHTACLVKGPTDVVPLQHEHFPPTLPSYKSFNNIMASPTKWHSKYKLLEPQITFLTQAAKANPDVYQDKEEAARLARMVCAPAPTVARFLTHKCRGLRADHRDASGMQENQPLDDAAQAEFDELGGDILVGSHLGKKQPALVDEERKEKFRMIIERFAAEHPGFELSDKTICWLQERYSRLRRPFNEAQVNNELILWHETPHDAPTKSVIPRRYHPKLSKATDNSLQAPGRQIGNHKTEVPSAQDRGQSEHAQEQRPPVIRRQSMSDAERKAVHDKLYGHDRQFEFVVGPVKALPRDMKRMARTQFSDEQDQLIIEAGSVIIARARSSGQRNVWHPFEQLFSEFTAEQIKRRFKTLASSPAHETFVNNLQDDYLQMLKSMPNDTPDDDPYEQIDFDLAEHIRCMRARIDMALLRLAGPRIATQNDRDFVSRLPSTLAELYDTYICKPASLSSDLTSRWPKYDKATATNVAREEELVENAFSSACTCVTNPISREVRLAADAIKVMTCTPHEVYSAECGNHYLEPLKNSVEAAAAHLEQHAVILKRGKENRRLPGRAYTMNDRFQSQLQSSLSANRIRQAIETEQAVDEQSLEWPIMCEDGDMIALFRMFHDNEVELSVDTTVSEHLRDPTDYQTRLKGDDEAVENLVEVMRTDTTETIQQTRPVVKPPLLPTFDVAHDNEVNRATGTLYEDTSADSVAARTLLEALLRSGRDGLALSQIKVIISHSSTSTLERVLELLLGPKQPLAFVAGDVAVSLVHIKFLKDWTMESVVYDVEIEEKEMAVPVAVPVHVKKPRKHRGETPPAPVQQNEQGQPRTEMVTQHIRKPRKDRIGKRLFPAVWTNIYGSANGEMWRMCLSWVQGALSYRSHATVHQLFIQSEAATLLTLQELILALQHLWTHSIVSLSYSSDLYGDGGVQGRVARNVAEIDWTDASCKGQTGEAGFGLIDLLDASATMSVDRLQEVVLSATHSASPVPTVAVHNVQTGAQLLSFKTPNAATTTATAAADGERDGSSDQAVCLPKTMTMCAAQQGQGGVLIGVGGKHGRNGINVWTFVRVNTASYYLGLTLTLTKLLTSHNVFGYRNQESVAQKIIPPVRMSTITLSPAGTYFAGGTHDGRIFLWELSSGTLLLTLDAHYRAVSVLEFTQDEAALVSGSEDAGVSVWSIGKLLNATPMNPPTPFATLTDHTLPITSVAVGTGAFPTCRILTGSMDATCKVWDISNSAPTLLSTFSFATPVTHVVWDSLERFFFAAGPNSKQGSRIVKVSLYQKRTDEYGYEAVEAVGGGGRGDVQRVTEQHTYDIADAITAMHLSAHSPLLAVGTAATQVHLLALPSLMPTRIIPAPPSSTPIGPITFVQTMLRPPELGQNPAGASVAMPARSVMTGGMGRTARNVASWTAGGATGRLYETRIGVAPDATDLVMPATGLSMSSVSASASTGAGHAGRAQSEQARLAELEQEVAKLKGQLGKAVSLNDSMWKKLVEHTLA
ncbi:hypothetical protein OIV83_004728 [Microbotryomycetes sp. JL201]|nr:hypothetical protein OIV83_004728 [Microbotryomycetes sp. JL201]